MKMVVSMATFPIVQDAKKTILQSYFHRFHAFYMSSNTERKGTSSFRSKYIFMLSLGNTLFQIVLLSKSGNATSYRTV